MRVGWFTEGMSDKTRGFGLILLSILVLAAWALGALIYVGLKHPRQDQTERAKVSCEREYGPGTDAALRCQAAISAAVLVRDQDERLSRATRGAR